MRLLGILQNPFGVFSSADARPRILFHELVTRWKEFHFLQIEFSSQQFYEKRLPNLDFLNSYFIEEIDTSAIDGLVTHWVKNCPKAGQRHTFQKELDLLKVVLNFYRKRFNASYVVPILNEHYRAADVAKRAQAPVQSLSGMELASFIDDLRASKSGYFASVALTQFCLGLRIGELLAIYWDDIDLSTGTIRIARTVQWDQVTWEPRLKEKPKNGKIRELVMPQILVDELRELEKHRDLKTPLVFHKKGDVLSRQTVAKAYNRSLERLGIKHVRGTQMVRKTTATLANEITGDFFAVQKLLDHSSPQVTQRYVASTGRSKQKIAVALNQVLRRDVLSATFSEELVP